MIKAQGGIFGFVGTSTDFLDGPGRAVSGRRGPGLGGPRDGVMPID